LPSWAEGIFVTSGPSKQELGDAKLGHIFDGFGRFSNVNFKDGKALFTSKMMKTDWYNRSMSNNKVAPSMLFSETTPKRKTSNVPGMNAYYFLTK
jgi:carotenoid cleavage dioxygenase-like enzyme